MTRFGERRDTRDSHSHFSTKFFASHGELFFLARGECRRRRRVSLARLFVQRGSRARSTIGATRRDAHRARLATARRGDGGGGGGGAAAHVQRTSEATINRHNSNRHEAAAFERGAARERHVRGRSLATRWRQRDFARFCCVFCTCADAPLARSPRVLRSPPRRPTRSPRSRRPARLRRRCVGRLAVAARCVPSARRCCARRVPARPQFCSVALFRAVVAVGRGRSTRSSAFLRSSRVAFLLCVWPFVVCLWLCALARPVVDEARWSSSSSSSSR